MKNIGRILVVLVFYTGAVFSQGGGFSFIMGFPQGEFKENVNSTAYGAGIYFVFWEPEPRDIYTAGISLSYVNYGGQRTEFFYEDVTYNIVSYHVIFQIFPSSGRTGNIRPYIETLVGASSVFANPIEIYDWSWNFGGGAGLMLKLSSHDEYGNPSELWLDAKCRYLHGSRAEYACESSADLSNGIFYPVESDLDMLLFNIGFTSYF